MVLPKRLSIQFLKPTIDFMPFKKDRTKAQDIAKNYSDPPSPERPPEIKKVASEPAKPAEVNYSLNNSELEGKVRLKMSKKIVNQIEEVNNEDEDDRFMTNFAQR